jgi:hypothetical protein
MARFFTENPGETQLTSAQVAATVNQNGRFTESEIDSALVGMSNENKIMYSEGIVYLI